MQSLKKLKKALIVQLGTSLNFNVCTAVVAECCCNSQLKHCVSDYEGSLSLVRECMISGSLDFDRPITHREAVQSDLTKEIFQILVGS